MIRKSVLDIRVNLNLQYNKSINYYLSLKEKFNKFVTYFTNRRSIEKIKKISRVLVKIIIGICLFLPLIIFTVQGIVKFSISIFDIDTKVSLNYYQHFLYSVFDISTNFGLSIGTHGVAILRNVNGKYFFLPNSYYSNPIDWPYGLLGSFIWFLCLVYFIRVLIDLHKKRPAVKKFKTVTIYLLILFLWFFINIGLFKPSSFIPQPKPIKKTNQDVLNNISLKTVSTLFLPFGLIVLICLLVYYLLKTMKIKFQKKAI